MSERWNAVRRTCAPSNSSSTVTAIRSCPGTSEHARFDSASGSIGSTSPGTYTEFARRNASRSSADPAGTNADTSAMCTHTRTAPSSSSSAEIASSKSRAVGGSIVNVGRSRRSRRPSRGRRRLARLALHQRIEAPPQPALQHQPVEHVAGDVGAPDPAHDPERAGPSPGPTSTRSPTPSRRGLSTSIRGPGSKSGETA